MWLMTPYGFISAVAKGGKDTLMVRARDRQSLEHYCDINELDYSLITEGEGTDYPFRVVSNEKDVEFYAVWTVRNITYSNFKTEAKRVRGKAFADFLGEVWSSGWSLTPLDVQKRESARFAVKSSVLGYPGAIAFSSMDSMVGKCDCCGKKIRKCRCTDEELDEYWDFLDKDVSAMTDDEYKRYEGMC